MSNKERESVGASGNSSFVPLEERAKEYQNEKKSRDEGKKKDDEFCLIPMSQWGSHTPYIMFLGM